MKLVAVYTEVSQARSVTFAPFIHMLKNAFVRILAVVKAFLLGKAFSVMVMFACMFVLNAHNYGEIVVPAPLCAVLCAVSLIAATNVWWRIFVGRKGIRAVFKELLSGDD